MNLRIAAILLSALLVLNIILFATGRTGSTLFWAVIAVMGIIAYFVFPKLKTKNI